MKTNKYKYLRVIQQNFGYGWEDVSEYESNSSYSVKDVKLLRNDFKEYQFTGYATRMIKRRELCTLQ